MTTFLSVLVFIIGFLIGTIAEGKIKNNYQEQLSNQLNQLAESMKNLAEAMQRAQLKILDKIGGKDK